MKRYRLLLVLMSVVFALSIYAGELLAQEQEKAPEKVYRAEEIEGRGFIPPAMDLSHIKPPEYLLSLQPPPSSWDWRTLGGVTPVKNQNPYNTCWAFAAIGDLESKVLINQVLTRDYSEHNVIACAPNFFYDDYGYSCMTGANAYITTNYLTQLAAVLETCDPYPGSCPSISCVNPSCAFSNQVTEWRLIANDVTTIKHALMDHGPVYTAMYSGFSGFSSYDGSYCLTYTGPENPDHAVLIVGWDDDMCGGNGGWIVKNSWGTSWGDNGYFYIQYNNAKIGYYTNVITDYKYIDDREKMYFYDEYGWTTSYTFLPYDYDDWGMVKVTPIWTGDLHAVDFWAGGSPTTYTIYVYDDFTAGSLSNLIAGPVSGTKTEAGYYSVSLPSPPTVTTGDPIYIAIRFQTPTYNWPFPVDSRGPMETGKTFASDDGTVWYDEGVGGYGDVAIRGRVLPHCYDIPMLDIEFIGTEYVDLGTLQFTRYWLEVVNRASVPDVMFEHAPDLGPDCGAPEVSRSIVEIFDQDYAQLMAFCVLTSASELDSLFFEVYRGNTPPDSVNLGLADRRCYISFGSDWATVPACAKPAVSPVSYHEVSWTDPIWEVQVKLENAGPGDAFAVDAAMSENLAWLTIPDPTCDYGYIAEGDSSLGGDTYTLDLTGHPGGPFKVYLTISYEDACLNQRQVLDSLILDPEATGSEVPEVRTFKLVQNYPNPFNPNTTINYQIPVGCHVRLKIFDVTGRLVRTLVDEPKERGIHEAIWNGRDNAGRQVASGVYFYRMEAANYIETKRMVLLR